MNHWIIHGGRPLAGSVRVQGSKNAVLPVIAASLLCPNHTTLTACPHISDVFAATEILRCLGCRVSFEGDTLQINTIRTEDNTVPAELTHRMRSSVLFLGPLLARFGEARVCLPGGCELGPRPIDLHLRAFQALGAEIREEGECIVCRASRLKGTDISLPLPSVGATENILIAACAAEGETVLYNAAREPEIVTLQTYLRSLGADVAGAGTSVIRIRGFVPRDEGSLAVPPDRIVASTYLCCALSAGGEITLENAPRGELQPLTALLTGMGCRVRNTESGMTLSVPERLQSPGAVVTRPYPGFPTDAMPLLMAGCLRCRGSVMFVENIFSSRFRHGEEMRRFGANVVLRGPMAIVEGQETLRGAAVTSPDLRGGAALVAAALGIRDTSIVMDPGHIDRGYENYDSTLRSLGADVTVQKQE